jgi:pyruvate dehydrogenase complex dehydrogenase (E1) component
MATKTKTEPLTYPFAFIERRFTPASYWFGTEWCPAVRRSEDNSYCIRVLGTYAKTGTSTSTSYDYFELDADGIVIAAPHGHAKQWKGVRVSGLDEAVAKYAVEVPV